MSFASKIKSFFGGTKTPEQPKGQMRCPYCFDTFMHDQVHFLIPYISEEERLLDLGLLEEESRKKLEAREEELRPFRRRESDELLENFWRDIGGAEVYMAKDYGEARVVWNSPVVTPENAHELTVNGYEKDLSGFVSTVTDRQSRRITGVRLCPHCHNPLPEDYGKYPTHFISIVGITSSGKTVYLTQLIGKLSSYLSKLNIQIFSRDGEAASFKAIDTAGTPLPMATTKESLRPPISITVSTPNNVNGTRLHTLVFFDIAGENCVDPKTMSRYGKYVEHSDGIILLMDPSQFKAMQLQMDNDDSAGRVPNTEVFKVLETMAQSFLSKKMRPDGTFDIPFAFTLSKLDKLMPVLRQPGSKWQNSPMFNPNVSTVLIKGTDAVVSKSERITVNNEVMSMIEAYDTVAMLKNNIERYYSCRGYFAVSALGNGCEVSEVLMSEGSLSGVYNAVQNGRASSVSSLVIDISHENPMAGGALIKILSDDKPEPAYFCYHLPQPGENWQGERLVRLDTMPELASDFGSDRIILEVNPKQNTVTELYYIDDGEDAGVDTGSAKFRPCKITTNDPSPVRVEDPFYWLLYQFGLVKYEDQKY